jgi:hypothetical protein
MLQRVRIVAALTVAVCVGLALGQDKKPDDKKPDEKPPVVAVKLKGALPQHFKKLGLRDDQIQKVYKIRSESKAKQDELRAKIEKLKADERSDLDKLLTADQRGRLVELRSGGKAK